MDGRGEHVRDRVFGIEVGGELCTLARAPRQRPNPLSHVSKHARTQQTHAQTHTHTHTHTDTHTHKLPLPWSSGYAIGHLRTKGVPVLRNSSIILPTTHRRRPVLVVDIKPCDAVQACTPAPSSKPLCVTAVHPMPRKARHSSRMDTHTPSAHRGASVGRTVFERERLDKLGGGRAPLHGAANGAALRRLVLWIRGAMQCNE